MTDPRKVLLGKAAQADAQRLKNRLAKDGIDIAVVHNAVTCTKGCSIQLEMWAHPDDVDAIKSVMTNDWHATVSDLGYDVKLADAVFDHEAEEATCPACGMIFSTSSSECPDCGLAFSAPLILP